MDEIEHEKSASHPSFGAYFSGSLKGIWCCDGGKDDTAATAGRVDRGDFGKDDVEWGGDGTEAGGGSI